jgi:anti-sigma regulatory factor (Ser/Thr protein kinase)
VSSTEPPVTGAAPRRAEFSREIAAVSEALDLVEVFAREAHLSATLRSELQFALDEIFTNFVKYNAGGRGPITVTLAKHGSDVVLAVADPDSPRFDPTTDAPEVDVGRPLDQRRPGGLGIYLLKRIADRVEYAHDGRTATITLHKRTN